jgi:hypothetical protein
MNRYNFPYRIDTTTDMQKPENMIAIKKATELCRFLGI